MYSVELSSNKNNLQIFCLFVVPRVSFSVSKLWITELERKRNWVPKLPKDRKNKLL